MAASKTKTCNLIPTTYRGSRGVTLIDTLVGTALMLVIFLGIVGAFQLSLDVVTNNKARSGAIALANERMEYVRSLSYASIGTVGGVPSGTIAQSETTTLNGVIYTRRTYIEYGDDPKDGTGASDTNAIPQDYKAAKVDISWVSRTGERHIIIVSRFQSPSGMEINCSPCGTLTINAVNAASQPISGASVTIVNPGASPAVNLTTFTDASGSASVIGAPVASGYQITVTKAGYSSAQTYSVTAQNTNPSPGNLTVANGQTTSGSFAIDLLGQKTIATWTKILTATWNDLFANETKIATSTNITVGSGAAMLSGGTNGELQSASIAPAYLNAWKSFSWTDDEPSDTSITYRVYDSSGGILIPDSQLPGNASGFTSSPVDLSGVSTTTYIGLRLQASLATTGAEFPSVDSWNVEYDYGPQPIQNVALTLQGTKTIGSGPSGTVYKYSQSINTGITSSVSLPTLEWDTYTISINGTSTSYDIASSCPNPQPEALLPGASQTTNLYLVAHTVNSLLTNVRSTATGSLLPGATVVLSRSGFAATSTTDACGQAFFSGLSSAGDYAVTTSLAGYTTNVQADVSVGGASTLSISL